jgi:glycosyltransferase involved in cell wall biosynthesis
VNILWLTIGDERVASTRVRAHRVSDALVERGHSSACLQATGLIGRTRAATRLRDARVDVLVLQKLLPGRLMLEFLRRRADVLVWECDDAIHRGYPGASRFRQWRTRRGVARMLRFADVVTTTNELLAAELMPATGRVEWFPGPAPPLRRSPAVRERLLVWLGSSSTEPNLVLLPTLVGALEADGWRCVAVGGGEIAQSVGWEPQPWSEELERCILSKASVGVMPQVRDDWSERKAAYKLLEYAASGVVPIASNVAPARTILDSATFASLLVPDELDSWLRAASEAFDRRVEIATELEAIVERFSARASAALWERAVGMGE